MASPFGNTPLDRYLQRAVNEQQMWDGKDVSGVIAGIPTSPEFEEEREAICSSFAADHMPSYPPRATPKAAIDYNIRSAHACWAGNIAAAFAELHTGQSDFMPARLAHNAAVRALHCGADAAYAAMN